LRLGRLRKRNGRDNAGLNNYSEFDCMDEPPDVVQCDSTQLERKDSRPPRDLLELVDYFPGKKLCWASELLEDEENKTS